MTREYHLKAPHKPLIPCLACSRQRDEDIDRIADDLMRRNESWSTHRVMTRARIEYAKGTRIK